MNLQKLHMGEAFDAYESFTHPEDGGTVLRAFAPNAHRITVTGQFNRWQEQPMEQFYWLGAEGNSRFPFADSFEKSVHTNPEVSVWHPYGPTRSGFPHFRSCKATCIPMY